MSQKKQSLDMDKILKENECLSHIQTLDKKIEKLYKKVKTLEREKKINNLIIIGYESQTKNNQGLKYELEDFNKRALKVEVKIRNAMKIENKVYMIEMENWQEKVKVLKAKSNLRYATDTKIRINNDFTNKEK